MINIYHFPITYGLNHNNVKTAKQKQLCAIDIFIHYSKTVLQTNHYKDLVASFTDSLHILPLKNISDYTPPNEKTGKACIVEKCKILNLVAFPFLPREPESTLVTTAT
jgi:hypothetical protein